jgi:hypothetical protein
MAQKKAFCAPGRLWNCSPAQTVFFLSFLPCLPRACLDKSISNRRKNWAETQFSPPGYPVAVVHVRLTPRLQVEHEPHLLLPLEPRGEPRGAAGEATLAQRAVRGVTHSQHVRVIPTLAAAYALHVQTSLLYFVELDMKY